MNITVDKERAEAEFRRDRRKWQIRRRFAVSSFLQLVLLTLFYIVAPFYMSVDQAKTFAEFNSIIITLIGFHSGIVMVYVGAVTYSDNVSNGVLQRDMTMDTTNSK